jgi:hypothetical protein
MQHFTREHPPSLVAMVRDVSDRRSLAAAQEGIAPGGARMPDTELDQARRAADAAEHAKDWRRRSESRRRREEVARGLVERRREGAEGRRVAAGTERSAAEEPRTVLHGILAGLRRVEAGDGDGGVDGRGG